MSSTPWKVGNLCSNLWHVGFHCPTRGLKMLTTCPIFGLWYGLWVVQCPASSTTLYMLSMVSSSGLIVWSMAMGMRSLLFRILQNHVTRWGFSSGRVSSTNFLLVISYIKTTPNAYTSALVVTLPVAFDKEKNSSRWLAMVQLVTSN